MKEQLNILLDSELKKQISELMRTHKLRKKSDAIRLAVSEAINRLTFGQGVASLRSSLGVALSVGKINNRNKFKTHDDLWS